MTAENNQRDQELLQQWANDLNGSLSYNNLSPGSERKVWWRDHLSHVWKASKGSRLHRGRGCPYCSNNKVLVGFNDLSSLFPSLADSWHLTKNGMNSPTNFSSGSGYKAWWICYKGHEWQAPIKDRKNGSGCPYCANKKVLIGFNDLATTHPLLAAEWHPLLNNENNPTSVAGGWTNKVWWLCSNGHTWRQRILERKMNKTSTCPTCSGRFILTGFNDLATTHPIVAAGWTTARNKTSPAAISANSRLKAWWTCNRGHEWETPVFLRTQMGYNCPYCSNQKVLVGFNDLATTHPILASEWHPTLNKLLSATEVTYGADIRVWWLCDKKNHEWETFIYQRTSSINPSGCPYCSTNVSKAEVTIATFLMERNINVLLSSRKVIPPLQLDIYVETKKVAVEFNGLYWHSENFKKDKDYHYKKWLACKQEGIQLIQIWEDSWKKNPELVLESLLHKLNSSEVEKVFARNTKVSLITKAEAEVFLEKNHIQGFSSGRYYVGLTSSSSQILVAVMVMRQEPKSNTLNIIRYATNNIVVGGFTKLLKHIEVTYTPDKIITFSDNAVSDGSLYSFNGFFLEAELPPDYMYVVDNKRVHKFNYRLKQFKNNPNLVYTSGLTEKELAKLNNIPRIWDAGKIRWAKILTVSPE